MTTQQQGASELTREFAQRIIAECDDDGGTAEIYQSTLRALCEHYMSTTAVAPAVAEPVAAIPGGDCDECGKPFTAHYPKLVCPSDAAPPEHTAQPTGSSLRELEQRPEVQATFKAIHESDKFTAEATHKAFAHLTKQPTGASEAVADNDTYAAACELLVEAKHLQRERLDEALKIVGDLSDAPAPNWREPLEALVEKWERNAERNWAGGYAFCAHELRELIDKLAAQQKGE